MTTTNNTQLDLSADLIDVRDIIARVEELEAERDTHNEDFDINDEEAIGWAEECPEDSAELKTLTDILEELNGMGGDEQWRGDWYPVILIRDDYFEDYARELAEDIGAVDRNATWPNTCIDWTEAAEQLQQDYSSVELDGLEYWTR